jgi:hypothetical protein
MAVMASGGRKMGGVSRAASHGFVYDRAHLVCLAQALVGVIHA